MGQLYEKLDDLYGTLYSYTQVAADFGLDFSAQRDFLVRAVTESAANRSAILGLALNQAEVARAAASTVPDDTDLAGQESAAEARVQITASALESSVQLLNKLEIDSTHYRQQLVTVTGEVTADSLDISVIEGLLNTWRDDVSAFLSDDAPSVLFNVFIFLLILAAAFYVGKLVSLALSALMDSPQIQLSSLAENMIVKTARNAILFIGLLIALAQLGVSLGPVLAGLGIAGFIVGFALQDTLSNFASGLLILIYRPFDVGDYVTAGGVAGRVSNMSLVNTTFKTPDNETLIVPNNKVWQDVIKNTTAQLTRRVDLTFGISYDDDIDKAKEILLDAAKNYPAVLGEPPTDVRVNELADSSVNLLLRPWVNTSDYWDTYWDLIEIVKKRFDAEGITIPFPQRDVHTLGAAADETETAGKAPDAAKEVSVEHGNVTSRSKDGQDLAAAAPEGDDTSS
jgi:small conductance mechanosensitive channel